jgi:CRISPR-associated exonuclease Cas4
MSEQADPCIPDAATRVRALTDLDSTLLVEAGAGTGKTSLLAARVTSLLMHGRAPSEIAAITFTEAAASELGERVHAYVSALLAGEIPEPMKDVLSAGIGAEQLAQLVCAAERLDGLTATTIHGFCQILLADFAVEADIDPGAQVIDADLAKAMFERVFDKWLTRRLSAPGSDGDPILLLTRENPRGVVQLLRDIADERRRHRTARAHNPDLGGRPDLELSDAVDSLKRWCLAAPQHQSITRLVNELEAFALPFADSFAVMPDFAQLWRLAHPARMPRMNSKSYELIRPRTDHIWGKLASAEEAPALEAAFQTAFERVDAAYRQLLATIASAITALLSQELDEVLADYAAAKRAAAVLDFDDLLELAVAMLRGHPFVRTAISRRFRYLLVDEFQDTDPVQCDIIFRVSGGDHADRWQDIPLREGALFLVGDPKQSLFLFRGAAIASYEAAKAVIVEQFPGNVLQVTSSFRTVQDILNHVNSCFREPLSEEGQPGYVALDATRRIKRHHLPCAARLTLTLPNNPLIAQVRDAEAAAVAEACARLVGGLDLTEADGSVRKVCAGDIGLLAPVGTDLWRYERALQARRLPYASKAGRGFFRRQEVQDLMVLTRALADPHDTLALGALLRGPLVGMTDEALLDVTASLPREGDAPRPRMSLWTPLDHIADPGLREVLEILQSLRRRARYTTPSQLLIEAVERLALRVVLTRREPRRASAANANVDLFLQRAAAYSVRGLRRFAQDMTAAWSLDKPAAEGNVDAEGEAIDIVSIHSAKGLEWPIVFVINMAGSPRPRDQIVYRAEDDSLHWTVGGVASPVLAMAMAAEAQDLAGERARLLYVACTRAKDLLILPRVTTATETSYARAVDLDYDKLAELDLSGISGAPPRPDRGPDNAQDQALFAGQAEHIVAVSRPILWVRPSTHDEEKQDPEDFEDDEDYEDLDGPEIAGAGRLRGLLLHKLLEELLGGALEENHSAVESRARLLLADLASGMSVEETLPDSGEVARTALATLVLPDVAALRPHLVPEVAVYALVAGDGDPMPLAGRADALAVDRGSITAVIDWKSDVAPGDRQRQEHVEQLRLYLAATGAPRGALVYASLGHVRWVEAPDRGRAP